jgi:3-polyprenyl-4-hydroxybenzoate decarboxylase
LQAARQQDQDLESIDPMGKARGERIVLKQLFRRPLVLVAREATSSWTLARNNGCDGSRAIVIPPSPAF